MECSQKCVQLLNKKNYNCFGLIEQKQLLQAMVAAGENVYAEYHSNAASDDFSAGQIGPIDFSHFLQYKNSPEHISKVACLPMSDK